MSQFTLTAEQDALVLSTLRNRATQIHAMLGTADSELEALIANMQAQLPQPEPVVEEITEEVVEQVPVEEAPAAVTELQLEEATSEEAAPAAE